MAHDLTHHTTAELVAIVTAPGERPLFADAVGELVLRYKNLIYKQALAASGGDSSLADDIWRPFSASLPG
jgi:hypothetical protein